MPAVIVPFVAVGVALLALLLAYAITVVLTPILEGLAREVPVIGGYIARAIGRAVDYTAGRLVAWANEGVDLVAHWFSGLADALRDFVDAVNAFIVELPDQLDHLLHVSVHEVVKAFVNPVRDLARDAQATAVDALDKVTQLGRTLDADFRGIEGKVRTEIDRALDVVRNADLPALHRTIDQEIERAAGAVAGDVHALHDFTDKEFAQVWDWLGKLPLQTILDQLAGLTAAGLLVSTIAREAGLDSAECRSKVRGICSADPGAWQALLDVAGIALLWVGIEEFVQLAQELARDTLPEMLGVIRGG